MKTIGFVCLLFCLISCGAHIKGCVSIHYAYEQEAGSFWELSDKSSTLDAKAMYIDKFVDALKKSKHTEYNAIIYKTPTANFDNNIKALVTLRDRLKSIKAMDEKSFAYQTAIQQITAQEQGEAKAMISVFRGCYDLENYWPAWSWLCALVITGYGILFVCALIFLGIGYDW